MNLGPFDVRLPRGWGWAVVGDDGDPVGVWSVVLAGALATMCHDLVLVTRVRSRRGFGSGTGNWTTSIGNFAEVDARPLRGLDSIPSCWGGFSVAA